MIVIQIETPASLENAAEIAAVDGVDVLMFGPGDFSVLSGVPGQMQHPKVEDGRRRVAATIRRAQQCLDRYRGRLSERSYAVQYNASATDTGHVVRVDLRDATLKDSEVEGCFRDAIAAMVVPPEALGLRLSGPVSGGETLTRERRIPLGSESGSENPFVFFIPFILETVGVEVSIYRQTEIGLAQLELLIVELERLRVKPDVTTDDIIYYQHELEPLVKLRTKLQAQRP